jgi:chromosome segregation ATPase
MNDSVDSFMYQKHSEKASRLDAIYSYKGDNLNVEDIDPEKLKFALIKDPEKRAKFRIDIETEEIENKLVTLQAQVDIFVKNARRVNQSKNEINSYDEAIKEHEQTLIEARLYYNQVKEEVDKVKKAKQPVDWGMQKRLEREEYNVNRIKNSIREIKNKRKAAMNAIESIHAKFDKMGIKKEADIERKERVMLDEINTYSEQLEKIKNNRKIYVEEARRQIAAESVDVLPLDELTKENVRSILSDLRPMDENMEAELRSEIAAKNGAGLKKSILIMKIHRAA